MTNILRRIRKLIADLIPSLNTNVGAASGFTAIADLATAVMSLLAAVVTARLLGATGRGELAAATTICGLAYMLGTLGLGTANTFYAAKKTIAYDALFGNAFASGIGLGLLTAVVAGSIVKLFPSSVGDLDTRLIYLGVGLFPLTFTELYLSYIIIGKKLFFPANLMNMLSRIVSLLLVLVVSLVHPVVLLVFAMFQSFSLIRLVMNLVYMRRAGLLIRPRLDLKAFLLSLAYATKARGNDIFAYLNLRFDVFVLNYFAQPSAVGVYSIGVLISEFSWYPSGAINKVIFPYIADNALNGSEATQRALGWCRITLMVTVVIGLAISVVGVVLVPFVFGEEFLGARWVIAFLFPGALLYSITRVLSTSLAGMGFPHLSSFIAGTTFAATLLFDILLIPRYGIKGAAIASSVAYMASALLAMGFFSRKTETRFWSSVSVGRREFGELSNFANRTMSSLRSIWKSG